MGLDFLDRPLHDYPPKYRDVPSPATARTSNNDSRRVGTILIRPSLCGGIPWNGVSLLHWWRTIKNTEQGVAPLRATSGARVNANVLHGKMNED